MRILTVLLLALSLAALAGPVAAQQDGPVITSPAAGDAIQGVVSVLGMSSITNFASAELAFAYASNPTGTWFHKHALDAFLVRVPEHVLVVLDEAYVEYVEEDGYPNGFDYLGRYSNLIVTRTFSKMYGLAGLRVGYAVANPQITNVLNRVRQPFNVNAPALAAAQASLNDINYIEDSKSENTAGLVQITEGLTKLNLHAIPSVANFIAFDCGRPAQPIYEALLHEGVIVRPIGGYGMPNHLRVSIGLGEENERFLQALQKVLA